MLYKRVLQKFSSEFEKQIKQSRRIISVEKQQPTLNQSEEIEHERIITKQPFYRFPIGLTKNFYYMAAPLLCLNFGQLRNPFYSEQLANAFCQINDVYLFGFAGIVGALIGNHYISGKTIKFMGLYSGLQLLAITGQGFCLYNISPFVFAYYFISIASHLAWYKYTKQAEGVPKTYNSLFQKSLIFSSLFMFVSIGAIIMLNEEYKSTEIKIMQLQKLSDAWNKSR